jgi:hypothetical protein
MLTVCPELHYRIFVRNPTVRLYYPYNVSHPMPPDAGHKDPADRDVASAAAAALCVQSGANIVRTHNVGATRDAVGVPTL